jgi:hypothetical protein
MPVYREVNASTLYEVVKVQTCSGQPLEVTTVSGTNVYVQAGGTAGDAFGRLRTSSPLTLFDSSHRYRDNGLWATSTGTGGTYVFSSGEGLVNLNVTTASGAKVLRETTKVCSYQPGKSLQVMNTFVMASGKANLRQRVGYFGADNGIYVEVSGTSAPSFVERNSVSGSVNETRVSQANWNIDTLDGQGPSGFTLDITKAQIHWTDIEWLGLGTVRTGFVINGQFVHCHSFHHANLLTSTYMTTASLPVRYEIENLGTTASSSTLKQVCSTVISEGGYELRGAQNAVGTPVNTPYTLTTAPTVYPIVSLRLKSTRLDAIVILTAISLMGITNNASYNWKVIVGGTTTGGTWSNLGDDSSVEYKIDASSFTLGTGRVLASGFTNGSNQGSAVVDILKEALFKFQLERNSFTGVTTELTLVCSSEDNTAQVLAAMDWEEVSR